MKRNILTILIIVAFITSFAFLCTPVFGQSSVKIDIGGGKAIEHKSGEKLKIGFFIAFTANDYVQAMVDEAEKAAKEVGAKITIFDGLGNPNEQLNQLEVALQRGEYNAWMVTPMDGKQLCSILSEDAPNKNVLVSVVNLVQEGHAVGRAI